MRRITLLLAAVLVAVVAWLARQNFSPSSPQTAQASAPVILKQPVLFTDRSFDPSRPPAEMPPLAPGEEAECDSNFTSSAIVAGRSLQIGAAHATVTVTQVRVTLGLDVIIWAPIGATAHVMEHEQGHRQISERYYQTADQLASRIAASYIGKKIPVTGPDLNAAANQALEQAGADITAEYNKQLNPDPVQLRYDDITDHARNEVAATDAVSQVLAAIPAS